jgi:hypothetical protein
MFRARVGEITQILPQNTRSKKGRMEGNAFGQIQFCEWSIE